LVEGEASSLIAGEGLRETTIAGLEGSNVLNGIHGRTSSDNNRASLTAELEEGRERERES